MSLFPRQDARVVLNTELKILYAMVHKNKIAPVKEIIEFMHETMTRFTTAVCCTSLVTRIANGVGALEGKNVTYIPTPRYFFTEQSMVAGHHLKTDHAGNLVYYFPGYINELTLPDPSFSLYKSPSLTFTLVEQEEERRSSVSRRPTRRHEGEASSSHGPSSVPPAGAAAPTFMFTPGYGYIPQEAGGSRTHDTPSSDEMPPPTEEYTRQQRMDHLSSRIGSLEVRTGNIENTLNTHVQNTAVWRQQADQHFTNIGNTLRRSEAQWKAYWRSQGFDPDA